MNHPYAYTVRFKGCLVAPFTGGLSRKPVLIRAGKRDKPFAVEVPTYHKEELIARRIVADRLARLECARAINRTEALRKRLQGNHLLRGIKSVERLLRDYEQTRRGKRWKICPLYFGESK